MDKNLHSQSIKTVKFLICLLLIISAFFVLIFLNSPFSVTIIVTFFISFMAYILGKFQQNTPNQIIIKTKQKDTTSKELTSILDAIAEPIIILDKNLSVILANEAAKMRLPNIAQNNPVSFGLRDPTILEAVEIALQTNMPMTVQYNERNAIEYFYEVNISPIKNANSHERIIILMRDITRLQRIENMRVDFVANASHELRTPLASIIGFIDTLQGPAKADPIAREKFLNIMGEQARRMSRLVDDLLALSRIELTQHIAPNTQVDMVAVTRLIVDTLRGLAQERDVEIYTNIPENQQFLIQGDRDEMLRVLENLIENAIKYGQSGKRVDVSLSHSDHKLNIIVRDYGSGIAPEHLPRLTERFYRANENNSREQGGTGLGLAIVKHIVTRHKGELKIESELGRGAKFTISIPVLK
jgi:two-component system, OmpR family, phosphate regulon sensor histidine kinase PhoR